MCVRLVSVAHTPRDTRVAVDRKAVVACAQLRCTAPGAGHTRAPCAASPASAAPGPAGIRYQPSPVIGTTLGRGATLHGAYQPTPMPTPHRCATRYPLPNSNTALRPPHQRIRLPHHPTDPFLGPHGHTYMSSDRTDVMSNPHATLNDAKKGTHVPTKAVPYPAPMHPP